MSNPPMRMVLRETRELLPGPRGHEVGRDRIEILELDSRVGDVMKTPARLSLQAAAQEPVHGKRSACRQQRPVGFAMQDGADGVGDRLPAEEPVTGEHLEENDPEGPHVGLLIDGLAARLFGRHVGGRSQDDALLRHRRGDRGRGRRVAVGLVAQKYAGEPEVEQLDAPILRHLDVRRFQVAMDDALGVRRLQPLGDLPSEWERFLDRDGPSPLLSLRSSPSASSITRKTRPSASSSPWSAAMLG